MAVQPGIPLGIQFAGPLNFSVGGNYLHYETEENYYVFINSLSLASYTWADGTMEHPSRLNPMCPVFRTIQIVSPGSA